MYTVGELPSWLTFNADSRLFYGIPTVYGAYTVNVTATDPWAASTVMTFQIMAGV